MLLMSVRQVYIAHRSGPTYTPVLWATPTLDVIIYEQKISVVTWVPLYRAMKKNIPVVKLIDIKVNSQMGPNYQFRWLPVKDVKNATHEGCEKCF